MIECGHYGILKENIQHIIEGLVLDWITFIYIYKIKKPLKIIYEINPL